MVGLHNAIFDRFLSSVPVNELDDADQFVREVKFMCQEHITGCPISLYKSVPTTKQPGTFFRSKNRHRSVNESGSILNQALQQERVFERGLDVDAAATNADSCIIFLPDNFRIAFSDASIEMFTEAAAFVDNVALAALVYQHNVSMLSEQSKHIIASNVPFYYCIRLK